MRVSESSTGVQTTKSPEEQSLTNRRGVGGGLRFASLFMALTSAGVLLVNAAETQPPASSAPASQPSGAPLPPGVGLQQGAPLPPGVMFPPGAFPAPTPGNSPARGFSTQQEYMERYRRSAEQAAAAREASERAAAERQRVLNSDGPALPADRPSSMLPKAETGALRFLQKFPQFDGRGITVAVFDSGVDPGANGLLKTSDGRPKVIDVIDATGSGDVDTSTIAKPVEGVLSGLTGRKLKIDAAWPNPTGEFHLGMKFGYHLFPGANDGGELVGRMRALRRKKWDEAHDRVVLDVRRKLADWKQTHPNPTPADNEQRDELVVQLEQLKELAATYSDPGPVYDCCVWHDGEQFRCCIDTDEDGDLTDEKLLREYHVAQEYGNFGTDTLLNYGVHVYNKGNTLSIVVDSSSHGTHVAGIIAGNYPETPELNGVAPGAQIVSVKIGDTRLGSMETGSSLVRAAAAVRQHRCDLINMSYGEPTTRPNQGKVIELYNELVSKHGVIFVSSAGNEGPALSTPGAPGSTTEGVIGVGAYFSPEMKIDQYIARKPGRALPYYFTSRGPNHDGSIGVDLFAPGGAISPIPEWTLQRKAQFNGTSMASPNACGNIALLLSALKVEGVKYSPASIERALQNSARKLDANVISDPALDLGQGPGVLQIDAAYDLVRQSSNATAELWSFRTAVPQRGGARGIYLREPHETWQPTVANVSLRAIPPNEDDTLAKVAFELPITLTSSAPWVQCGDRLLLASQARNFEVIVDPSQLSPGVHVAEIVGTDTARPQRGPLFRFPVTVIKPNFLEHGQTSISSGSSALGAGSIHRHFVATPEGATWAELQLTSVGATEVRSFDVHALQVRRGRSHKADGVEQRLSLQPGVPAAMQFAVEPGTTLEVAFSSAWQNAGDTNLQYTLKFFGVLPSETDVSLSATGLPTRVDVASLLAQTNLAPAAELNRHRRFVAPGSSSISLSSDARDQFPDGRVQSHLLLTYEFELADAATVRLRFPQIDELLYDAELEGELWQLYDSNKRRIAVDDMRPEEDFALAAGKYTVQLQLAHSNPAALESFKSLLMAIDRELSRPIPVVAAASRTDAAEGSRSANGAAGRFSRTLRAGERTAVYLAAPTEMPAGVSAGDLLLGSINWERVPGTLTGTGRRPVSHMLHLAVPNTVSSGRSGGSSGSAAGANGSALVATVAGSPPPAESLSDALREAKYRWLEQVNFENRRAEFDELVTALQTEAPTDLRPLLLRLQRLDHPDFQDDRLPEIVAAADAVLAKLDSTAIAAWFGTRHVAPTDAAENKKMELARERLIDTLYRKGRALGYMDLPEVVAKHPVADPAALEAAFNANYAELQRWVDVTDRKYALLHIRKERRAGHAASALKWVHKYLPAANNEFWFHKKREELCEQLGWTHQLELERRRLLQRFPKTYEPF